MSSLVVTIQLLGYLILTHTHMGNLPATLQKKVDSWGISMRIAMSNDTEGGYLSPCTVVEMSLAGHFGSQRDGTQKK